MEWLVTVRKTADLERLARVIFQCGGTPTTNSPPVPLGESELVLVVSGPEDLPRRLLGDEDIIDVNPSSEMELY